MTGQYEHVAPSCGNPGCLTCPAVPPMEFIRQEMADIIHDGTVGYGPDRDRAMGWLNALLDIAEAAQSWRDSWTDPDTELEVLDGALYRLGKISTPASAFPQKGSE